MISLLKSIVDIIISLVQFVINTIESLINLIGNFPKYISFIVSSIDLLPSILIPFCIASVSIYVVYTILGRSQNG